MFEKFSGKEHALLICNHRSDIDWLVGWVLAQVVFVVVVVFSFCYYFRQIPNLREKTAPLIYIFDLPLCVPLL